MKLGKKNFNSGQRKILFVSGNAGDEKNLHLGGHNFFNGFPGDNSLGSLAFFAFLFFEIKSIYFDTHSTIRTGEW